MQQCFAVFPWPQRVRATRVQEGDRSPPFRYKERPGHREVGPGAL